MDIHEYQAKELLSNFGVSVPEGALAYSPEQAAYRARELGGEEWVVKAQVHAGGRGRAGGIRVCRSDLEVQAASEEMFGRKLVTHQTGPEGRGIYRVYVENVVQIEQEYYLGFVLDRLSQRIMIVASSAGGMEVEDIAAEQPKSIARAIVEPAVGLRDFQCRQIAFNIGIEASMVPQVVRTMQGCYRAFTELDATMVEINPMVVTTDHRVMALDAKMTFDDNALFRHPQISELRDMSQEDRLESYASDRGLRYVPRDGKIACIVNGQGFAMATLDTIKLYGGSAANYLDIGGGATSDRVAKAMRLILSDKKTEAVLINVFAGINRCDWVAEGVVQVLQESPVDLPIVIRLAGNRMVEGQKVLAQSGLPVIRAATLAEAAERVVGAWASDQRRKARSDVPT